MKPIQLFFIVILMSIGFDLNTQTQPMNIMECIEMAVEKNISVKQSELALNDAEINKDDAKGNFADLQCSGQPYLEYWIESGYYSGSFGK